MKLKEKLAKEYANRESTCPMNDFLAGFEKARKMALELESKFLQDDDYLMQKLSELGEEEVE